jgi:hypothetical protein
MKDLEQIDQDFRLAISGSYDRNQQCLEDIRFAKIAGAQWAGADSEQFKNKPKPENNKLFKQVNRLLGQYQRMEMNAKIASASDDATDEDAELLQGRWRNDFNMSDGVEALNNAADDAFFGGFGAIKVVAKYENEENPSPENQYLCVEPVYSAPSSVVFDAGSIRKDKQDAKQVWQLSRVNRKATEEEFGVDLSSYPQATSMFDWCTETNKDVYVAHYYEVIEKNITDYDFGDGLVITAGDGIRDSFGNKLTRDELKELTEANEHEVIRRKTKYVEYALLSGDKILVKATKTPFKSIPIIPQYGYHTIINGIEYYCGEVARQRDNQRFLNMGFGALMEILAEPQVEKREYAPEQIAKHAQAHANRTIDNPAFLMSDPLRDKDGNIAHLGPVAIHGAPNIGSGLAASIQFLNGNMDDQSGTGQSTLPSNVSGDAVRQVNDRQDDAFQPLYQNAEQALKAAAKVWIPAAQKLYFSGSRNIRIQGPDGEYSQVETLKYSVGKDDTFGPNENTARGRYDVTVKAGESHKSTKEAEKRDSLELLQYAPANTPMGQMALMGAIQATTGEGSASIRKMARYNEIDMMIQAGMEPNLKTDEERQHAERTMQRMQQQAQNPQKDLATMEGEARLKEGEAAIMNEQNDAAKIQVDMINAETKRMEALIKAQEAGVKIENTQADTMGKRIDNIRAVNTPIS